MFPVVNDTISPGVNDVDFSNPQKDTTTINWIYCICIIGFLFQFIIGLCLCAVLYNHREWRFQISMILLACILTAAAQCLILICLCYPLLGVHIWEMSLDDATWATKLSFIATLLFIPGTTLARLALCITSCLFVPPERWSQNAIRCTGGLLFVVSVTVWFVLLFACKPVDASWNLRLFVRAQCIDRYPFLILQAFFGVITDSSLVVVVAITTLGLKTSWKNKAIIIARFSIGLLPLGATLPRLRILFDTWKNPDTTFVLAPAMLWLIIEANLVIICSSLPYFNSFIKVFICKKSGNPSPQLNCEMDGDRDCVMWERLFCAMRIKSMNIRHSGAEGSAQGSTVELAGGLTGPEEV